MKPFNPDQVCEMLILLPFTSLEVFFLYSLHTNVPAVYPSTVESMCVIHRPAPCSSRHPEVPTSLQAFLKAAPDFTFFFWLEKRIESDTVAALHCTSRRVSYPAMFATACFYIHFLIKKAEHIQFYGGI